ncbi:uncharacterized protein VTP21DRAFT_7908 [Calcarisporiella thermophila]|uniref:uncharacterized protein n=1 Tax=Calcarisporiella thermophila TaxID=911321 RepID=UPI00374433AB
MRRSFFFPFSDLALRFGGMGCWQREHGQRSLSHNRSHASAQASSVHDASAGPMSKATGPILIESPANRPRRPTPAEAQRSLHPRCAQPPWSWGSDHELNLRHSTAIVEIGPNRLRLGSPSA